MTPDELRTRLAFLGYTEADRENLAELAPILEKNADSFIGAFYQHLLSFEPTRRLLADPKVKELTEKIKGAKGIILATPVYNFNVSASAKNLIELTGDAWNNKVVGIISAAGGKSSYMAPMGLINSLMLDFRCLIVPRFVQAVREEIPDNGKLAEAIKKRIRELNDTLIDLTKRMSN